MQDNNNRREVLIKKSLIYLIGNFSSKILGTLIIPIYAAFLTASELGNYDYQQSVGNLLSPLFALAIWEAILRFGLGKSENDIKKVISSALIIAITTLSISLIILTTTYINIYDNKLIVFLYILLIMLMPLLTIFQYTARATGNNVVFVKSSIISSFSNLGSLFIFVVILKGGLIGLLISTILANLINILYISFNIKIWAFFSINNVDYSLIRTMLKYSLPLALNLMSVWFITGFSRFYTNLFLGTVNNGIYAFAAKFSMILATLSQVVNMAIIEDTVLSIGDKDFTNRFEKTANEVINLLLILILFLMPIISIYYNFVPNADYRSSINLVPVLLYSTFLQNCSTVTGNIFNAYNKTNVFFYTTFLGSLLNVFFTFILGSYLGLKGVAIAQIIGFLALFLSRYFIGRYIAHYKIYWKKILIFTIIYVFISYLSMRQSIVLDGLLFITIFLIAFVFYKDSVEKVINKILKK
ncbi:oligosaccharide flippase family protein [Tetragenococcus halophilus]|uniref:oligosaccharide flippase family protein n=1 Tax=Tetragenococcus halophilus TaxID=51669 RepID=UPI001B4A4414|nr:oligosaccharide flippase family protein [Tetragenococcus halophilus]GFK21211.1 exopolysaccharide protein Wzx [Tetragenococcus halophilus]